MRNEMFPCSGLSSQASGLRALGAALTATLGAVALAACGASTGAPPANPTPPAGVAHSFLFTRTALPGVNAPATISYTSPPYPLGTANDGQGHLSPLDPNALGYFGIYVAPRVPYDVRMADFNGDGIPDFISSVYSPTNSDSWAYLFLGNPDGTFTQDTTFGMQYTAPGASGPGYRGRTETIVVADFNNDGAVDIFLPTYTFLDVTHDLAGAPATFDTAGPPPNVYNASQSYLLLNDGTGHFTEAAVNAGVSMHSLLSGLSPASTDPEGLQPEGAQALDFNMDGLIDLYVGGHLFINQGVDAQGVPHFKDMAGEWGLTQAMLRAAPPWASDASHAIPGYALLFDEGARFLDWDNDGTLDLLELRWDWGAAHGARLFEFTGTRFRERLYAVTTPTETCKSPAPPGVPFFYSTRPTGGSGGAEGINSYDLDNDGLEDVMVSGDKSGPAIFRNYGCGFVEVSAGDLSTGGQGGAGGMALLDLDGDGSMDVVYPAVSDMAYYENTTPQGFSFTVEVVGPNGEHNQYGRVIQVFPPGSKQIYTRIVDGGSGYLTQNQYLIVVGSSFSGAHNVKVYFAPLQKCIYGGSPCHAAVLNFAISPGHKAVAYAPTTAYPSGRAVID
jgi:hypothetical protein